MFKKVMLVAVLFGGFRQVRSQDLARSMVEAEYLKCVDDVTSKYLKGMSWAIYHNENFEKKRKSDDYEFRIALRGCHERRKELLGIISGELSEKQ